MLKSTVTVAALAFTTLGWQQVRDRPHHQYELKEERMTLEYTPAKNEAVVRFAAESEVALSALEIRNPDGSRIIQMDSDDGNRLTLSGFVLETSESSAPDLFRTYRQGGYDIRASTVDGQRAVGRAYLSHDLLREPLVVYPRDDAVGVSTHFVAAWMPDPEARSYQVTLEQGDSDGLVAKLLPGTSSFRVPEGILAPGTETFFEIAAINESGNCTVKEVRFFTR